MSIFDSTLMSKEPIGMIDEEFVMESFYTLSH